MSSPPPGPKPYSVQLAERIHNTTGKEYLMRICFGGLLLESFWHGVIERRILKTPAPAIGKSMRQALKTWPLIYVVTTAGITWAEWKVNQAERARKGNDQRDL
ncbi:hypothetical protein F4860DRAFT_510044 [Xylaria cubensis]|nr:hypothetical protein F4860DRAFT_510044 [Xylaria cubensis]